MSTPAIWLSAILLVFGICLILLMVLPSGGKPSEGGTEGISVDAGREIVTIRKIGAVTSMTIRREVHDHWDGPDGVDIPELPIEVTRREEPALYAEYLSADTPASRKYEIADELYSRGYTLPYIRGLNEQYKREVKEAITGGDPDGRTIHERTPVNLTPSPSEGLFPGTGPEGEPFTDNE